MLPPPKRRTAVGHRTAAAARRARVVHLVQVVHRPQLPDVLLEVHLQFRELARLPGGTEGWVVVKGRER